MNISLLVVALIAICSAFATRTVNFDDPKHLVDVQMSGTEERLYLGQDISDQKEGTNFECLSGDVCYVILHPGASIQFDENNQPYIDRDDPNVTVVNGEYSPI